MNIKAINTAESSAAVQRVKNFTSKKFNLGVSLEIPKEFIEKRTYMQSNEFLEDSHNIKMFDIIDEMMELRDSIAQNIENMNAVIKDKFAQGINGFCRIKSELDKDFSLNFSNEQSIPTLEETQYRVHKNALLFIESQKARK